MSAIGKFIPKSGAECRVQLSGKAPIREALAKEAQSDKGDNYVSKSMVLAVMIGCSSAAVHANTQVSQLNWRATASKETNMEVALTHPGLQAITGSGTGSRPDPRSRPGATRISTPPIVCKPAHSTAPCHSRMISGSRWRSTDNPSKQAAPPWRRRPAITSAIRPRQPDRTRWATPPMS